MTAKKKSNPLTRREALSIGAGAAATAAAALNWPSHALAKEPAAHSIKLGDIELTVLSDGHMTLPAETEAPKADAKARAAALKAAGQTGDKVRRPINVTLVRTPTDLIMIDVGSGSRFMGTAGKLASVFEAKGIDPEKITKVVYTHAHPDHLWGTFNDFDELSFPNAAYYISAPEWNFWMAGDLLNKLPADRQFFGVGAQRNLKAIKDKIKTIQPGQDIITGLRAIDTAGHTPGHISIEIGSAEGSIMILGDALTHRVISFAHPAWQPASDQDKDRAVKTRLRLLDKLATDKIPVVGYHLPFPGLGTVTRRNAAYAFTRAA